MILLYSKRDKNKKGHFKYRFNYFYNNNGVDRISFIEKHTHQKQNIYTYVDHRVDRYL